MAPRKKNPHAVALGRLGGKVGGKVVMRSRTAKQREEFARLGGLAGGTARAKALSPTKRSEIARKAAEARWSKPRQK
jgi:hypothetical protein